MSKKWAILIVAGMMAAVYLFLLVGIPMLISMTPGCGSSNASETAGNSAVANATADWVPGGPPLDVRSHWEAYKAPWIIYSIPGLVGTAMIVMILKRRQSR